MMRCATSIFPTPAKTKNDGLTSKTPIRSWARYLKIKTGNENVVLMGNPETILKRLYAEIEKRNQHQFETG
jgi:hypothetical protein